MSTRRGTGPSVLAFAVVSVALASTGHLLGHGHLLDLASLLVAVVLAAALGVVLAARWTAPRLLVALALVQGVVHGLGTFGADPRLVTSVHAHGEAAITGSTGSGAPGAMLAWHLAAVPVAALLLVAVRRSAVLVAALARRLRHLRPVVVRALPPAALPDLRPVVRLARPHLLVVRSNAPPCRA